MEPHPDDRAPYFLVTYPAFPSAHPFSLIRGYGFYFAPTSVKTFAVFVFVIDCRTLACTDIYLAGTVAA